MYVGATGPQNFHNVQMYFVRCMAPVHVRDRKTQCMQVIQKEMYTYKSQKCDLYAICIIRYGLISTHVGHGAYYCSDCLYQHSFVIQFWIITQ